jgi:hypothetical protein
MIRTLTPIFSIIISLVIFFFFTQPKFAHIKTVQGEAAQFEGAAAKAAQLNAELTRMLDEKRKYPAEAMEKLDALVPENVDEVKVLNDLNELAKSHNMMFGNVSVTNSDLVSADGSASGETLSGEYEGLTATNLSFSLIGGYDQFKAFLADVEQSLVMVEVQNIEFTTGEGALQQYSVGARVFALKPIE